MSLRKRQRSASSSRLSTLSSPPSPPRPTPSSASSPLLSFPSADVVLRLHLDPSGEDGSEVDDHPAPVTFLDLHVSSASLLRSRYFAALLSDRWCPPSSSSSSPSGRLSLAVPPSSSSSRPFRAHFEVLRLLHTLDFAGAIRSPTDALDILPIALQLLFDACVEACIRFLEAVPWSEEEEARVLDLAPLLPDEEAADLLARVSLPPASAAAAGEATRSPTEAMLHGLIQSAIHGHTVPAATKAFVAMLLKDYPSRDCVHKVLDGAFLSRLETVKELMGKYASPDFRVAVDSDEREAIQKLNLHSVVLNMKHLLWLIERMVDMRVADNAVKLWSEQAALAADLQKLLNDADMLSIMTPGLPMNVTRCTLRLANSVVIGETLVPRQVRMNLVKSWLPVLNVLRDLAQPMLRDGYYSTCQELEVTFLQIISTLPVPDAQELLQRCLGFSTRSVNDCPHLVSAFKTWFRRAGRVHQGGEN